MLFGFFGVVFCFGGFFGVFWLWSFYNLVVWWAICCVFGCVLDGFADGF